MSAHRWWRLYVLRKDGQNPGLNEIGLRSVVGGVSVAAGGTAFVSSSNDGSAPALFDGNTAGATQWQSGTPGAGWAGYVFGSAVDIAEVAISFGSNAAVIPSSASLQWSDDGSRWVTLAPAIDLTGAAASTTVLASGFTAAASGARCVGTRARMPDRWPATAVAAGARGTRARFDSVDSGPGRIAGDVAIEGPPLTPVARRVRLFDKLNGRLVRETFSDPVSGAYQFSDLAVRTYFVVTEDHTNFFNAVIADRITPEV